MPLVMGRLCSPLPVAGRGIDATGFASLDEEVVEEEEVVVVVAIVVVDVEEDVVVSAEIR